MKPRQGYTLIELLIVLAVLGVLATIALPYYWETRHRASATQVVADYNVVRVSALGYHATNNTLPPTYGWGVVPTELESTLPDNFSFMRGGFEYRWQVWSGTSLGGEFANTDQVAAMEVRSADAKLIQALRDTYQGRYIGATSSEVTLLIQ